MNKQTLEEAIAYNQKRAEFYADKLLGINQEIVECVDAYDYGRASKKLKEANKILGLFRKYKIHATKAEFELHKEENNE